MASLPRKRAGRLWLIGGVLALGLAPSVRAQNPLVTGKYILPAGSLAAQNVGSLPMNMVLSPNGKFAVASDMGFRQQLTVLDTKTGLQAASVAYPTGGTGVTARNGLYYGLAFDAALNADGTYTLYAAQGGAAGISVLKLNAATGALAKVGVVVSARTPVPAAQFSGDFPSGLGLFTQGANGYLAVANNTYEGFVDFTGPGHTPKIEKASLSLFNRATGLQAGRYEFATDDAGLGNYPLAVAALDNGSKIYVGSERDGKIYVINAANPAAPALAGEIVVGSHPDALLFNADKSLLYVANANSDTISVISTATDKVTRTVLLRPDGARGLPGVSPTGLALSPDGKTLYVTLGDMNAVAVVDAARGRLKGYIPVGWYPSSLVVSPDSERLLVANAKGTTTRYPNPAFKTMTAREDGSKYGLNLIEGNVLTIAVPNPATLATFTGQVIANNRITPTTDNPTRNPLAAIGLKAGKIRHVIYIIKENRTYDQVLGDLPRGNNDPALTLFGRDVTPNLHALAERFVQLDNFYVCAEASGDGWPWSTKSFANENVIKNLPYNYSGRGRQYDFEGQNSGYLVGGHPARDVDGNLNSILFPNGAPPIEDIADGPAGSIWDVVRRAGLSYRNYGFALSFGVKTPTGQPVIPDNYPASSGVAPEGHDLAGITDYDFRRFDSDYPDSDAPSHYSCVYPTPTYGKYKMPSRFSEFRREFNQMLQRDATGAKVPAFLTMRLMNDHTQGFSASKPSPKAQVADNDYGVGQLVDLISHSPIWKDTAIFIVEDDAQDGPDHVDSHRSPAYVISPWIRRSSLDSAFYNTDSILKTMELLLGVPAMSQYDAIADPIPDWDTAPNNSEPYNATLPAQAIICEKTPAKYALKPGDPLRRLIALTETLDFTRPDSANARLLNEILWKGIKGPNAPMPEPRASLKAPHSTPLVGTNGKTTKGKSAAVRPARRDND